MPPVETLTSNSSEAALVEVINDLLELTKQQTAALDDSDFQRLRVLTGQKQAVFNRLEPLLNQPGQLSVEARRQVRRLLSMEKYNLRLGLWREQECGAALTKLVASRFALDKYAVAIDRPHAIDEAR